MSLELCKHDRAKFNHCAECKIEYLQEEKRLSKKIEVDLKDKLIRTIFGRKRR